MSLQFDLAQSFYIDKGSVENAAVVHLTSVDLYFKYKPEPGLGISGIYKPGVSVYICPLENDQPNLSAVVEGSRARVEYDNINVDDTTANTPTKFTFSRPIVVATDASYAFLIKIDGGDSGFYLWYAVNGQDFFGTSSGASINSGYNDGSMFKLTNGNVLTKQLDMDLKFNVNVAKFTQTSRSYVFRERKYELFKYFANSITGDVKTGEYVYKNTAAQTGTVSVDSGSATVTGAGGTTFSSTFAAGDYVVISDGTAGNTVIRVVSSTPSASSMVLDENPHFTNASASYYKTAVAKIYLYDKKSDHLILTDSNANSTLYFANNDYIKCEDSGVQLKIESMKDFDIGRVTSQFNVVTPAFTSTNTYIALANSTYYSTTNITPLPTAKRQFIDNYDAIIGSRSLTKDSGTLFSTNKYTVNGSILFTTSNQYTSPYIEEPDLDVLVYRYIINNDATNEERGQGNAMSRYISKRVVLGQDQDAEDMRVYVTAYLPQDTSIKLYAKMINGEDYESIDLKNWTPLEEVNPVTYVSSSSNKNDTVEKEYRIPYYHLDGTTLSGYGSMITPNTVISTTSDLSGSVNASSSSLVRVYQEATPNNFFVSLVTSANSSTITIADNVTNTSFNAAGLKIEKVSETNKYSAFVNPQNKNVVRYYTNDMSPQDSYKMFMIKIVLLSPNTFRVPLVKDVRAIAVSA